MVKNLVQTVKAFLAEKQAIAARERQLIEDLNRVLPEMGYRVVPTVDDHTGSPAPSQSAETARRPASSQENGGKTLSCPHCSRNFARPLHLGRHMAATHSRPHSRSESRKKRAA